jgi:hypothetical protein
MKPTALFTLLFGCTVAFAQQQTVKIVTSDVTTGPMAGVAPGGMPMKTGTGVIFGQVTEADSNRPVAGAIVTVNLPGVQPLRVMADGQGRFGFRQMPPGAFNVTATRPGWVDGAFGRTRPGGPTLPIMLTDGERVSGVTVPMWRYATIAGTVVDEAGDPVIGAQVRVLKRSLVGGRTTLKEYQQDTTDDRGVYRVSQLEPGDYVVAVPMVQPMSDLPLAAAESGLRDVVFTRAVAMSASAGGGGNLSFVSVDPFGGGPSAGVGEDGRPLAFATSFFPNAPVSTRAQAVTVSSGEERSAVDFQLHAVPTSKISGIATGPDGAVPNLQITLVPAEADDNATSIETLNGFSDGSGRFTIEGVPPGNYMLRAVRMPRMAMPGNVMTATITQGGQVQVVRSVSASGPAPPLPTDNTLWSEMTIAVANKDVTDLSLSMRPGVKMSGMLQFNGTAQKPAPETLGGMIGVVLEPADQHQGVPNAVGRVDPSGSFGTIGVPPGRYFVRIKAGLPGWTLQSVTANGRDASVVPVDLQSDFAGVQIIFTDRPSELSGQVTSDGPVDAATVLVFPAESAAWVDYGSQSRRFANLRVDKSGNFKVQSLPAGDYLAVAIPDKMANDWQNPKFLESLTNEAARVHVRDGEKVTANLKVAR